MPATIHLDRSGKLAEGVTTKDVILHLVGRLDISRATCDAVEFGGQMVAVLALSERATRTNMVAAMGSKAGPVERDSLAAEIDARYMATYAHDLSTLRPQVAAPHTPDCGFGIDAVVGRKVNAAFIDTCTNGQLEDVQAAAPVLARCRLAPGVRLVIAHGSGATLEAGIWDGTVQALSGAGATFVTSGCSPCVVTHQGVPGDGEMATSSINRILRGRQGNSYSQVYLSLPLVLAAAALAGEIINPVQVPPK